MPEERGGTNLLLKAEFGTKEKKDKEATNGSSTIRFRNRIVKGKGRT